MFKLCSIASVDLLSYHSSHNLACEISWRSYVTDFNYPIDILKPCKNAFFPELAGSYILICFYNKQDIYSRKAHDPALIQGENMKIVSALFLCTGKITGNRLKVQRKRMQAL